MAYRYVGGPLHFDISFSSRAGLPVKFLSSWAFIMPLESFLVQMVKMFGYLT